MPRLRLDCCLALVLCCGLTNLVTAAIPHLGDVPLGCCFALVAAAIARFGELSLVQTNVPVLPPSRHPEEPKKLAAAKIALKAMRDWPQDVAMQKSGCGVLAEATRMPGGWLNGYVNQNALVKLGAHLTIIEAMKSFQEDGYLQMDCTHALGGLGHLNAPLAVELGDAGAMEALGAFVKAYPNSPEIGPVYGIIGGLCDWSSDNRRRIQRQGVNHLAVSMMHRHHDAQLALSLQCFVSTQCMEKENYETLLEGGYIQTSIDHMREFPHMEGLRGEVIFVMGLCFDQTLENRAAMVESGLIEEIVKAMHDAPHMRLDVLTVSDRVYGFGTELLAKFVRDKPEWRQRALQAGALQQVHATIALVSRQRGQLNEATRAFGFDSLDVLASCQKALSALLPQGA